MAIRRKIIYLIIISISLIFFTLPVKADNNQAPFRAIKFEGKINTAKIDFASNPKIYSGAWPDKIKNNKINYLLETQETQITQSIRDLAQELNYDPLNILNYVKNNIDYLPYYGSKKGADACLVEKIGNDFDQASLLIALLRASNIQAGYKQANIKIDLSSVMDLLGVESPEAAAKIFSKTNIPYILYVDQNENPVFFVLEHIFVEAYLDYNYTRGISQDSENKQWINLDPSLSRYYYSQHLNILQEMGINISDFYEDYLSGDYQDKKPIQALEQEIEDYLALNHPDLIFQDILLQTYKAGQDFEFIPQTLPYEIVEQIADFAEVPENLKHNIKFIINNLDYKISIASIANKNISAGYVAATQEDQDFLDNFESIYDVAPISSVNLKPVIKINGEIKSTGSAIQMGRTQDLILKFFAPKKQITGGILEQEVDLVELQIIVGNSHGIAINTDKIVLPELRPSEDTQTSEFLPTQKLYRTALNYLDRLQRSHDELASIIGARFTNSATRAIVFNGVRVHYQGDNPYQLEWTGLRIDSSAVVNYYNYFGTDVDKNIREFMYIFGLEASLDESLIFEQDFDIKAMSTTKGLVLINQGQIPNAQVIKITNLDQINNLQISDSLKAKYRNLITNNNIIYTPNQQYTYENWTGLVYIYINPETGFGGYIIGEGLNGGWTVEEWLENWRYFWETGLIDRVEAVINLSKKVYILGEKITYSIFYKFFPKQGDVVEFSEETKIDSEDLGVGMCKLQPKYEAVGDSEEVEVKNKPQLGAQYNQFDDIIISEGEKYNIPPDLLKSLIHQEAYKKYDEQLGQKVFETHSYRYEAHKDYDWYSRQSPSIPHKIGWRGLGNYPEKHFAIAGHVVTGEIIPQGDQVPSGYCDWSIYTAGGKLKFPEGKCTGVTAADLYSLNPDQKWKSRASWNFTAQLILAASYGLTQTLYETAVNRGFDNRDDKGQSARSITELFDPEIIIDLASNHLKRQYDQYEDWWNALKYYNGGYVSSNPGDYDSEDYADAIMKCWDSGVYKLIP